jgi:predicted  nucleic acid-binding Zn-ribbon protein
MNTTAYARKSSLEAEAESLLGETHGLRSQRWSDKPAAHKPLAARHDLETFEGVSKRPANDEFHRGRPSGRVSPQFIGSRYFWAAVIATVAFCLIFAVIMGFRSPAAIGALLRNPVQYSPFLISVLVIAAIQWVLAVSAHRQAMQHEMWRRMMALTQRLNDPGPVAEEASRNLGASFDRLINDLDSRMAALDERTSALSHQIATVMQQAEASAELNMSQMRNVVDATEVQKDTLQRVGAMISTEVLPVIAKLETTVAALDSASQNAGGILDAVGGQLQQSARDLQACLEDFNRANHTVAPEIEKRVARFEATMTRLPDQLEATLSRLSPMSETIADAAMLSTANVEVIEQINREISESLANNRDLIKEFADANADMFQQAVDMHIERFRDMLAVVITEEVSRLSAMSRELGFLAETAGTLVDKLHQPINHVSSTANKALAEMNTSIAALDERIQKSLNASIIQLNNSASQVVSAVSREIEGTTISLQTRLAASSNDLVQRVNTDAARFEGLIGEAAEKAAGRLAMALRDLPSALSQRMEGEIAKVDGTLKGSIVGLSDQMRTIIDGIPSRLTTMTRETLQALESNLERSFDGVAQRSQRLNEQFRKNATETTESVLENYVDFIFLALKRFRSEMEVLNGAFHKELEASLKAVPARRDAAMITKAAEGEAAAGANEETQDFSPVASNVKPISAARAPGNSA